MLSEQIGQFSEVTGQRVIDAEGPITERTVAEWYIKDVEVAENGNN